MSPTPPLRPGWVPDNFDSRDKIYYYRGQPITELAKNANLWDDHPDWLSGQYGIYNQGDSYSCVANAIAAAVRFLAHKQNLSKTLKAPSRLFIYYNARLLKAMDADPDSPIDRDKKIVDTGCKNRDALRSLTLFGVAPNSTWRFNFEGNDSEQHPSYVAGINDQPPHRAYVEAKSMPPIEYLRLDPDNDEKMETFFNSAEKEAIGIITLARVKQCLIEGYPVIFTFRIYRNDNWLDKHENINWIPSDKSPWHYLDKHASHKYLSIPEIPFYERHKRTLDNGHTVLAVGFEDLDDSNGRILCQNSYGSRDSHAPHFWMSYDWIRDFGGTDDFWMIRSPNDLTKVATPGPSGLPPPKPEILAKSKWPLYHLSADSPGPIMAPQSSIATSGCNIFCIDRSQAVNLTRKIPDGSWSTSQVSATGSAGQSITAISTDNDTTEVYWVAPKDSSIQGIRNSGAEPLAEPFSLPFRALPSGPIHATTSANTGTNTSTIHLFWLHDQPTEARTPEPGPAEQTSKSTTKKKKSSDDNRILKTSHRPLDDTGAAWSTPISLSSPISSTSTTVQPPDSSTQTPKDTHGGPASAATTSLDAKSHITTLQLHDGRLILLWITTDGRIQGTIWSESRSYSHSLTSDPEPDKRVRLGSWSWSPPLNILGPYSASSASGTAACESPKAPGKVLIFCITPRGYLGRYVWDVDGCGEGNTPPPASTTREKIMNPLQTWTEFPARVDSDICLVRNPDDDRAGIMVLFVSPQGVLKVWMGAEKGTVGDVNEVVRSVGTVIPGTSLGVVRDTSGGEEKLAVVFGDYDDGRMVIAGYLGS